MTYHQIPIMKRVMTPQKLVPAQHGLPTVDLALSMCPTDSQHQ